jgi:hypothetical protein
MQITWFGTMTGGRLGDRGGMAGRTVIWFVADPRPDATGSVRYAPVHRATRLMHLMFRSRN